jgi:hypothetical protein
VAPPSTEAFFHLDCVHGFRGAQRQRGGPRARSDPFYGDIDLTPSHLGHSVGWYEDDKPVIDTVGIKVTPLSSIDLFDVRPKRVD